MTARSDELPGASMGYERCRDDGKACQNKQDSPDFRPPGPACETAVALLTGGADKPYALGLATALISRGVAMDVIGNDDLNCPELSGKPEVNYLNLRGDQQSQASLMRKTERVLLYYAKLLRYAATAEPRIFHILWNNKFEFFDRTALMIYYKLLQKKIVLTLHNVNARRRDATDGCLNRITLGIQYRLADHIFVHTERMKCELIEDFRAQESRITVIPFGLNNAIPQTELTSSEARCRLGIREGERTMLFFGHIAPYKGLEYLVSAFRQVQNKRDDYRLIIAGRPKNCERYWNSLKASLEEDIRRERVLLRADFIPDEETEIYFKAADVLVLPYKHIYQSGVLFLGYGFGLPALAADVGSLRNDIVEGETGYVCQPENSNDLARVIEQYFASELYADLNKRRKIIKERAMEQHSWDIVSRLTIDAYARVLDVPSAVNSS